MTTKTTHSTASPTPAPVILFGIDSTGKPKAARFGKNDAALAIKAASQLQLRVLAGDDPKLVDIAGRLPVGRVHTTGRMFVPFIRRDLYDKLVAVAPNGNLHQPPTPPASGASGTTGSKPPGSLPNLPRHWSEIGIGDLVVAEQDPDEGWYEAIVVEANGDMLSVRWRDYPRERGVVRHRNRLGLLYPEPKAGATTSKPAKPATAAGKAKPAAPAQDPNARLLPRSWQEIDVNQLVLAKADGPWSNWWEAIPIEKAGDGFQLRWRDGVNKSPITRPRFDLALIRPDAA